MSIIAALSALLGAVLLGGGAALAHLRRRQRGSAEESELERAITRLRARLHIRREDGFLLRCAVCVCLAVAI